MGFFSKPLTSTVTEPTPTSTTTDATTTESALADSGGSTGGAVSAGLGVIGSGDKKRQFWDKSQVVEQARMPAPSGFARAGVQSQATPATSPADTIDQYGGYWNTAGNVVFPSDEAVQAAVNDPAVLWAMYNGEYGPAWQHNVSDPYTLHGLQTGTTVIIDRDPGIGAIAASFAPMIATAGLGSAFAPLFGGGMLGTMGGMGLASGGMALAQGAPLEDALKIGAMSGLAAGAAPFVGEYLGLGGSDILSNMARTGITTTGMGMLQGMDFDDALEMGLRGAGTAGIYQGIGDFGADAINSAFAPGAGEFDPTMYDFGDLGGMDQAFGAPAQYGGQQFAPIQLADASGDLSSYGGILSDYGVQPGAEPMYSVPAETYVDPVTGRLVSTPATTTFGEGINATQVPADAALEATNPGLYDSALAAGASTWQPTDEELTEADLANREALEAGDEVTNPEEPLVTSQDVQKYVKVAQQLYEYLDRDAPTDAPQRGEGMSDEEYAQELGTYIEVDLTAETMAELGLEPGTQEYYDYIMAEADRVIDALVGEAEGDELAAQLRSMTEAEIAQLERALYVRGQMNSFAQQGSMQIDPVTGEPIQVGVTGGGMINPGTGAYQSGLARDIAGITSADDLRALLGRQFDPYGMQRAADARSDMARRSETEEDEWRLRRARGMLSR